MTSSHLGKSTQRQTFNTLKKLLSDSRSLAVDTQSQGCFRRGAELLKVSDALPESGVAPLSSLPSGNLPKPSPSAAAPQPLPTACLPAANPQVAACSLPGGVNCTPSPAGDRTADGNSPVDRASKNQPGGSWLSACISSTTCPTAQQWQPPSSGGGSERSSGFWLQPGDSWRATANRIWLQPLRREPQLSDRLHRAGFSTLAPPRGESSVGVGQQGLTQIVREDWSGFDEGGTADRLLPPSRPSKVLPRPENVPLSHRIKAATSVEEIEAFCSRYINVFHATAAIHRLAKLIGVQRSLKDPGLASGRPEKYAERASLLNGPLLERLVEALVSDRGRASTKMLCLQLWSLARLRYAIGATPRPVVVLAEELEARLRQTRWRFEGRRRRAQMQDPPAQPLGFVVLPLTQALWGLSQLMRADAPWAPLFTLIAQELEQSKHLIRAGPASAVLKAASNYYLVHGSVPLPPPALDMLAEALTLEDETETRYTANSPQAMSQGLYALAKLGHNPGEGVLHELARALPSTITAMTVHRQAVGNSLWALAQLGYPIPNTLYKQMVELVLQHCHAFMACHFDQVLVALRLWDRRLTVEQMQTFCRGLVACLPAYPTPLDALEWNDVAEELVLLEPYYRDRVPLLAQVMQLFQVMKRVGNPASGSVLDEDDQSDRQLPASANAQGKTDLDW